MKTSSSITLVLAVASLSVLAAAPRARAQGCSYVPMGCQLVSGGTKLPDKIDSCFYIEGATGSPHTYTFLNVVQGGAIYFAEKANETTDFRVSGLLIEKGGLVQAGAPKCPYGAAGGQLKIGLWGDDPTEQGTKKPAGAGITCMTNPAASDPSLRCFPADAYATGHYCTNAKADPTDPCSDTTPPAVEPKNALLEPYKNLNFDTNPWGYKTIGVAYGGALLLYGNKGAKPLQDASWASQYDSDKSCVVPGVDKSKLDTDEMKEWAKLTGSSWARLVAQNDDATSQLTTLTLDRTVADWKENDEIVVGATDWHPSHSELRTIRHVFQTATGTQVQVDLLKFPHFAQIFDVGSPSDFTNPVNRTAVDTRAVVGLLSRSIKVYSLGDASTDEFPKVVACMHDAAKPDCYFGGHLIARQGFRDVQIQGVEFKQLGQGGRMGHYPVHFHLAKTTSYTSGTFVKDSSVWDSMTRFVVLHGTHDVNVSRNVGYLSLGHGYYIEDASEIRNRLCHNLGVSARAGLQQYVVEQANMEHWCGGEPPAAARLVPPILDGSIRNAGEQAAGTAAGSDTYMPVMYWMMNAYNEFVGNAAVSVHGFGSCFWLLGSAVSGPSLTHQFDGFASYNVPNRQSPLLRFRGNSCMTSPLALPTTREIPPASNGFQQALDTGYVALGNPYLTNGATQMSPGSYARPIINGSFQPLLNGLTKACSSGAPMNNAETCVMTVLDRFATSFNWAEVNFGSIWLRPWFYLFSNGAVTDQLFGGLGFVTGGDWQQALPAYLALAQNSLFVGTTQPQAPGNRWARRSGPRLPVKADENVKSYSLCPLGKTTCNLFADGTGLYHGSFQPKRLITIYDGPTYADGNTFINVGAWSCNAQPCKGATNAAGCTGLEDGALPCGIYTSTTQPASPTAQTDMVVIDAAIGWKQPNGFFYPPAFTYRRNAFLDLRSDDLNRCFTAAPGDYQNVTFKPGACRHNVVDRTRDYVIGNVFDLSAQNMTRQSGPLNQLDSGTIDFATILLDLDGSLTGATSSIDGRTPPGLTSSVSKNRFFDAPAQSPECLSYGLQTSPYTFITTSVARLTNPPSATTNSIATTNVPNPWPPTPAVAIYRQWKLKSDENELCGSVCDGSNYGCPRASFMGMASIHQSPFLTMTQPPGLTDQQRGALYYLDTNSGVQSTSCVKGSASLQPAKFAGDQSYVVYNIFPQRDSVSSYQLYVGGVKNNDLSAIDFRYVRVTIHEIDGGGRQQVLEPCDPLKPAVWCSGLGTVPSLRNGILTVTLDHKKLLKKSSFSAANREKYDQCMPRDLCYFDKAADRCKSCLTNPSGEGCLRKGDFLSADVSSMNRTDANDLKPLDTVCEQWATLVSGETRVGGDTMTTGDCPVGGCLGFAFKLPTGFIPQFYQVISPQLKLSRCFLASAWTKDLLVQRENGSTPLDPQCGAPQKLSREEEFCDDPMLDLPPEADASIAAANPTANEGQNPALLVEGDGAQRSLVAFDELAIESRLAARPLTRATLMMTTLDATDAPEEQQLIDAHPLLQNFEEGGVAEPDADLAVASSAESAGSALGGASGRLSPARPLAIPIGTRGRRLPIIEGGGKLPGGGGGNPLGTPGVTWDCAVDADVGDDRSECVVPWETPGGDFAPATAPAVAIGPPGTVMSWDVTDDVLGGVSMWVVKKRDESDPGGVAFYSEEGAISLGDPELAPILLLE